MEYNFEKLSVYNKASDFVSQIYSLTRNFPKDEMFGLTIQLRRAALSILVNIAEGTARTRKDFSRFVDIARGSTFECAAILQVSLNQKYINQIKFDSLRNNLLEISKMLSGLKRSLNL